MPDALSSSLEHRILERKLLSLASPWAGDVVFPYYDGLSIRNLPHTVVRLLDGRPPAGLFGTDQPHPEAGARLGDPIVIAREGYACTDRQPGSLAPVSRHGGLSSDEMLVPLLMRTL